MLSMPPATITSASPSWMAWAASTTAFSPEPQALFTVKLGTSFGTPPSSRGNVAPPAASRHPLDSDSCATETGALMARFALIMSGGGARGAYEAGVLSYVLDDLPRRLDRPVRFQILTGTSVGAIHACY